MSLASLLRFAVPCANSLLHHVLSAEDKHQPVGCAIFLASELDKQLERIEDAARGWIAPATKGAND